MTADIFALRRTTGRHLEQRKMRELSFESSIEIFLDHFKCNPLFHLQLWCIMCAQKAQEVPQRAKIKLRALSSTLEANRQICDPLVQWRRVLYF